MVNDCAKAPPPAACFGKRSYTCEAEGGEESQSDGFRFVEGEEFR